MYPSKPPKVKGLLVTPILAILAIRTSQRAAAAGRGKPDRPGSGPYAGVSDRQKAAAKAKAAGRAKPDAKAP